MMTDHNLFTRLEAAMLAAGKGVAFEQSDGFTLRYDQMLGIVGRFANTLVALGGNLRWLGQL